MITPARLAAQFTMAMRGLATVLEAIDVASAADRAAVAAILEGDAEFAAIEARFDALSDALDDFMVPGTPPVPGAAA